jgi:ribosomal protein S12 methylthiotransferase
VRLLYAYPNRMTSELMETLGGAPGVLPYLDVPLQHASKSVLSRMRRGGSRESFTRMIADLRRRVPDLSLRTTFITGFPGETEEEFEDLRSFAEEIEFDHFGVFTYSHEPGAPSSAMPDDVPASLKSERRQILTDLQEAIAFRRYRSRIGSKLEVLVEGPGDERGTLAGRAAFQAPEVDGDVIVRGGAGVDGFATVTVEDAVAYQLSGRA